MKTNAEAYCVCKIDTKEWLEAYSKDTLISDDYARTTQAEVCINLS